MTKFKCCWCDILLLLILLVPYSVHASLEITKIPDKGYCADELCEKPIAQGAVSVMFKSVTAHVLSCQSGNSVTVFSKSEDKKLYPLVEINGRRGFFPPNLFRVDKVFIKKEEVNKHVQFLTEGNNIIVKPLPSDNVSLSTKVSNITSVNDTLLKDPSGSSGILTMSDKTLDNQQGFRMSLFAQASAAEAAESHSSDFSPGHSPEFPSAKENVTVDGTEQPSGSVDPASDPPSSSDNRNDKIDALKAAPTESKDTDVTESPKNESTEDKTENVTNNEENDNDDDDEEDDDDLEVETSEDYADNYSQPRVASLQSSMNDKTETAESEKVSPTTVSKEQPSTQTEDSGQNEIPVRTPPVPSSSLPPVASSIPPDLIAIRASKPEVPEISPSDATIIDTPGNSKGTENTTTTDSAEGGENTFQTSPESLPPIPPTASNLTSDTPEANKTESSTSEASYAEQFVNASTSSGESSSSPVSNGSSLNHTNESSASDSSAHVTPLTALKPDINASLTDGSPDVNSKSSADPSEKVAEDVVKESVLETSAAQNVTDLPSERTTQLPEQIPPSSPRSDAVPSSNPELVSASIPSSQEAPPSQQEFSQVQNAQANPYPSAAFLYGPPPGGFGHMQQASVVQPSQPSIPQPSPDQPSLSILNQLPGDQQLGGQPSTVHPLVDQQLGDQPSTVHPLVHQPSHSPLNQLPGDQQLGDQPSTTAQPPVNQPSFSSLNQLLGAQQLGDQPSTLQPLVEQPSHSPLNQLPGDQQLGDQPSIAQPPLDQPPPLQSHIHQPPLLQPYGYQPSLEHSIPNQPPSGYQQGNQPATIQPGTAEPPALLQETVQSEVSQGDTPTPLEQTGNVSDDTESASWWDSLMSLFRSSDVSSEPQVNVPAVESPGEYPHHRETPDIVQRDAPAQETTQCPDGSTGPDCVRESLFPFQIDSMFSGLGFDSLMTRIIAAAVTLLLCIIAYFFVEKRRMDGSLVARVNTLERELMVLSKENSLLKEESQSNVGQGQLEVILEELKEAKAARADLEEQVATLERDLDEAAEANMELNQMLAQTLENPKGSTDDVLASVERLQAQLDGQRDTIGNMSRSISSKNAEIEGLKVQLTECRETISGLEAEVATLNDTVANLRREKEDANIMHVEKLQEVQNQLAEVLANKVLEESRLGSELSSVKLNLKKTKQTVVAKESEVDALKESLKQLKSGEVGEEKLVKLFDAVKLHAQVEQLTQERDELEDSLRGEGDARKRLEDHVRIIEEEVNKLRVNYEEAQKEKVEAQTRLEVLGNYFKEKEAQLKKELDLQEILLAQQRGDENSVLRQVQSLQEEVETYRSQNESLKREILDQERDFKGQIATLEKKSHDNWVSARQVERKLEESRQEAGQLRNRLTLVEKSLNNPGDAGGVEANGEGGLVSPVMGLSGMGPMGALMGPMGPMIPPPPPPIDLDSSSGLPFLFPPLSPGSMPPHPHFMPAMPPPPPPLLAGDRRPPPLGRMSSPPPAPPAPPGHFSPPPPHFDRLDRPSQSPSPTYHRSPAGVERQGFRPFAKPSPRKPADHRDRPYWSVSQSGSMKKGLRTITEAREVPILANQTNQWKRREQMNAYSSRLFPPRELPV